MTPIARTGKQPVPRPAPARHHQEASAWRADLPREWQDMVVAPLSFVTHRDYEIAAERNVGRDEDGAPCYVRSHFIVTETRTDDDEEYYQVAAYAESQTAWRLRDGRWLVLRIISRDGEPGSRFFSFAESMPR